MLTVHADSNFITAQFQIMSFIRFYYRNLEVTIQNAQYNTALALIFEIG